MIPLALIVVLIIVVAVAVSRRPRARFVGTFYYAPSCGTDRSGRRRTDCRGYTTGAMPAIETVTNLGNGICGGVLGVPP
jgi:hypothetical protein